MQQNKNLITFALLCSLILTPFFARADILSGIPVSSDGGLLVGSPDDPFWFQISGALKIDQRNYWGDTDPVAPPNQAGTYNSGAFIRDFGITFDGGVGKDWTYTIALNFDPRNSLSRIDDAFLTYYGFEWLLPNFTFSVGQVIPGFCISCATSSKWIPFLERSMGTNVFGPQQGLGASANTYNNNYSVTIAATEQPRNGQVVRDPLGNIIVRPDLWQGAGRFTWAPIAHDCKVLQFGLSAHIQEYSNTGLQFTTLPEMRSGSSISLLNTTTIVTNQAGTGKNPWIMIAALNQKTVDFEIMGIYGPWSGELEYQRAYITRGKIFVAGNKVKQGQNLQFSGYHAQASYVLTGESRPHKKANGTMGQIKPKHKYGAWEVSARYSYVNLNDKDVFGGAAHNTSASLGWYVNNNIKFLGEYVHSLQSRRFTTPALFNKRHLSSVGFRMQVVF